MNKYAVYDIATSNVRGIGISPEPPNVGSESGVAVLDIPFDTPMTPDAFIVHNGALAARTPTFAENQRSKLIQATQYFGNLFRAPNGFTWSGSLFQIDDASLFSITAMGADADRSLRDPANFPWDAGFYFIAADNSHMAMSAAQMAAFSQAVATYVRRCRYRVRAIKDAIAAASGQAALDALDVTQGYPTAST